MSEHTTTAVKCESCNFPMGHLELCCDCRDCKKKRAMLPENRKHLIERAVNGPDIGDAPPPAAAREGDGPYRVETFNEDRAVIYLGDAQVFTVYGHILARRFMENLNAAFHAGAKEQREKDAEITRGFGSCHHREYIARAIEGGAK